MNSIFNSFMDIKKDNINLHLLKKKLCFFYADVFLQYPY